MGDKIAVLKIKDHYSIRRGDIVIYLGDPIGKGKIKEKMKRVAGLPGEYFKIDRGEIYAGPNEDNVSHIYIKGIRNDDSNYEPLRIPDGSMFLLGDNMKVSRDSRDIGPVPFEKIQFKAFAVYWPLWHVKLLTGLKSFIISIVKAMREAEEHQIES